MKIVVYDLNQTLYKKSSKDSFFKFVCYKRELKIFYLFQLFWIQFLHKTNMIGKTTFKENFYNYLNGLPPEKVQKYAEQFWNMEFPELFNSKMLADIKKFDSEGIKVFIVTGGFEVYIKYLEKILPVKVIGTKAEYRDGTYKVIGEACNGEEKIKRLNAEIKEDYEIIEAYSDEKEPILFKAKKGYYIDGEKITLIHQK
ncbi:HAD family hydrolase [Aequorivita sp. SDUM287046]|uniref:HAD family hydrolase n=1 Tax=Aequorivita aurantiaca TaxID=3053356 RepID=A0ABT8DK79_9FLAO|nr:HAD family hydrolase [Aequorivita aurantiaca]MDN3724399.1 HAD family hydrolase [Aequorivita aurantiaca]